MGFPGVLDYTRRNGTRDLAKAFPARGCSALSLSPQKAENGHWRGVYWASMTMQESTVGYRWLSIDRAIPDRCGTVLFLCSLVFHRFKIVLDCQPQSFLQHPSSNP